MRRYDVKLAKTGAFVVGILGGALLATRAGAIYLDENQNVSFRARLYSHMSIRTEDSRRTAGTNRQTNPPTQAGQLIQHRNFYNPELEAKLGSYTRWMRDIPALRPLVPDSLDFRLAAWGFYDGLYDYGSSQFDAARRRPRLVPQGALYPILLDFDEDTTTATIAECKNPKGCFQGAFFARGTRVPSTRELNTRLGAGETLQQIFREVTARETFASQNRINELYVSYTKGPFFLRLGKQTISWGESDTIALLDANNPFDVSLALPGIFQDLDESRIPLWTVRSTLQLFNTLGPFSSGFIEAYWVPGDIDTSVAEAPIPLGVSPYSPGGVDPQLQFRQGLAKRNINQGVTNKQAAITRANTAADNAQLVILDLVPEKRFENSRYGVRLQTIVAREHTVSAWYYTTFTNTPVPRLAIPGPLPVTLNVITRGLTHVFGIADTFFLEPLDTIVRTEAEYFLGEPSFIEWRPDLPPKIKEIANLPEDGSSGVFRDPNDPRTVKPIPRSNHLRWEVGFDRFMFIRPLNPTNSFFVSVAFVGDWNLDETKNKDFGFGPGLDLKTFDNAFAQGTIQTDYMHGKLTPRITTLGNYEGAFAVVALADYRITDWLLLRGQYVAIDGAYHHVGFNRDRDQASLRLTYQLN